MNRTPLFGSWMALSLGVALTAGVRLAIGAETAAAPAAATTANKPGEVDGGDWKSAKGVATQDSSETPAILLFGENTWTNYTLELEAQKTGGDEGFLIAVRAKDSTHLVWFNVGGWGNTRTAFEGVSDTDKTDFGDNQTYSEFVEVSSDKWHKLKVTVSGNKIEGFLDGKSACKATTTPDALAGGKVAVGTWSTQANFRNIKVTDADGKVLWEGVPSLGKQ